MDQIGDAIEQVARLGGVAPRGELVCSDRTLRTALSTGRLVRLRRGVYALPVHDPADALARRLTGVLSHTSAALAMGWSVARPPDRPHVSVARGRVRLPVSARLAHVHYAQLSDAERAAGHTEPLRTVIDCARTLPFGEALAVADSALRSGLVGREELRRAAERLRGPASSRVREVARFADPGAANAFESGARAICLSVPGLAVRTQVGISDGRGFKVRVDLADAELGVVIECDGFTYHGGRQEFLRDRRRYTGLVLLDWTVFLLIWEDVFVTPEQTRRALAEWVARRRTRPTSGRWRGSLLTLGAELPTAR